MSRSGCAIGRDDAKAVPPEAFHRRKKPWQPAIRHQSLDPVHRFRGQRDDIPKRAMRLREIPIRRWFQPMPRIGKLHGARNKENRHIVANKVPISTFRIKRDRPPYIMRQIR